MKNTFEHYELLKAIRQKEVASKKLKLTEDYLRSIGIEKMTDHPAWREAFSLMQVCKQNLGLFIVELLDRDKIGLTMF